MDTDAVAAVVAADVAVAAVVDAADVVCWGRSQIIINILTSCLGAPWPHPRPD